MHGAIVFSGSGPLVILTSHSGLDDRALIERLATKGITKFIGYSVDVELLRSKYGNHFSVVQESLNETDDLRILDFDGHRAFKLISFDDFGPPVFYEEGEIRHEVGCAGPRTM